MRPCVANRLMYTCGERKLRSVASGIHINLQNMSHPTAAICTSFFQELYLKGKGELHLKGKDEVTTSS